MTVHVNHLGAIRELPLHGLVWLDDGYGGSFAMGEASIYCRGGVTQPLHKAQTDSMV